MMRDICIFVCNMYMRVHIHNDVYAYELVYNKKNVAIKRKIKIFQNKYN